MKKHIGASILIAITCCWILGIAEAATAKIGEKTVFTEFNYAKTGSFSADPNNPLPLPGDKTSTVVGNTLTAALTASPGQAGQAEAELGVLFSWDYQGLDPNDVKDVPVKVAFDYTYEISANWTDLTGSANAGVGIPGLTNPLEAFIGFQVGIKEPKSGHIVKPYETTFDGTPFTVDFFNPQNKNEYPLFVRVLTQAHSVSNFSATNSSLAKATVNTITVETPAKTLALELSVVEGDNKIGYNQERGVIGGADGKIFRQTFIPDGSCNVAPSDQDPKNRYRDSPFSGAINSEIYLLGSLIRSQGVKLRAKIKTCLAGRELARTNWGSSRMEVQWYMCPTLANGTEPTTNCIGMFPGSAILRGTESDFWIKMPDKVGAYTVHFDFNIDKQPLPELSVNRKLFVTKYPNKETFAYDYPLLDGRYQMQSFPKLLHYEKATAWAQGESNESDILSAILKGIYDYGRANWKYNSQLYDSTLWEKLIDDSVMTEKRAYCPIFSDVFKHLSETLGIGGLFGEKVLGSEKYGFLTFPAASLDPDFKGNAKPLVSGGSWDSYHFNMHYIVGRGDLAPKFYDATFNKVYDRRDQFVRYNKKTSTKNTSDPKGSYFETVEGARIYELPPSTTPEIPKAYVDWFKFGYTTEPTSILPTTVATLAPSGTALSFSGTPVYGILDVNGDGIYEGLTVDIAFQTESPGAVVIFGSLSKNGAIIADRPTDLSTIESGILLAPPLKSQKITLTFSGEQIFQSAQDGPYEVVLNAIGENNFAEAQFESPVYDHRTFGEVLATVSKVAEQGVDSNSDSRLEGIVAHTEVNARIAASYHLHGSLIRSGQTLVSANAQVPLTIGTQQIDLVFPGIPLKRSGLDGPYEGVVSLIDRDGRTVSSQSFQTQAYKADSFVSVLEPTGTQTDRGIDINGNGLFDALSVTFGGTFLQAGTFLFTGSLSDSSGTHTVYSEELVTVVPGDQTLTLEFVGSDIHALQMDGPYRIDIALRDPESQDLVDQISLPQETQGYRYAEFDPNTVPANISVPGTAADQGIDTNGNGLFDELQVDLDVEAPVAGDYAWSAHLADAVGTEIGFHTGRATLVAGKAAIRLLFNGTRIGANGRDGPYFVRDLRIFGGATKLVRSDAAQTAPFAAKAFEGYQSPNQPPVAKVGPDLTATVGESISFSAADSFDPDNGPGPLTYRWTQADGPSITLYGSQTAAPSFSASQAGTYRFNLIVHDGQTDSAPATVAVVVNEPSIPYSPLPVADAGPDIAVKLGENVTLSGAGSVPLLRTMGLTFFWSQSGGPAVILSNANMANAGFRPETPGTYTFQLRVGDGTLTSTPDEVTIAVEDVPLTLLSPVGGENWKVKQPQVISWYRSPALGSVPPRKKLSVQFSKNGGKKWAALKSVAPSNNSLTWKPLSAYRSKKARIRICLPAIKKSPRVCDQSTADFSIGSAKDTFPPPPVDQAPQANPGSDRKVRPASVVKLDGSLSSDSDGSIVNYLWEQLGGPVVALSDATLVNPLFTAPNTATPTDLRFRLTVTDNQGVKGIAILTIRVTDEPLPPVNQAPQANAGSDRSVDPGASVTLDGSQSHDPDGYIVSYAWEQTAGPTVTLRNPATVKPSFEAPTSGVPVDLVFQLTAIDNSGANSNSTVTIKVMNGIVYENTARSGEIRSNEHWRGVIDVTGDVTVFAPGVLTIEPGTIVRFAAGQDDQGGGGNDPITDANFPNDPAVAPSHMGSIVVADGDLYAVGSADSYITFTSSASVPQPSDWQSLYFSNSLGKMTVQYAVIEYAYYGIQVATAADQAHLSIANNFIKNIVACGICLASNANITSILSGNDISKCGHEAIDTHLGNSATIENNLLHDSWNGIVLMDNTSTIRNNTFSKNGTGIFTSSAELLINVSGNLYSGNIYHNCSSIQGPFTCPDE